MNPTLLVGMPLLETKWLVSGTAFATLCCRRDLQTAGCILGAVLNALMGKVLKRVFNMRRPDGAELSDPGMPSSHSQSLFFFASYLSTVADEQMLHLTVGAIAPLPLLHAAVPTVCFGFAAALAYLRVRAGLHTVAQVSVGAVLGTIAGSVWAAQLQPALTARVLQSSAGTAMAGTSAAAPAVVALLVLGALVVGSAERVVARWLKKNS